MTDPRIRFVIGGAQKAGTSALARYLSLHPRLRLPHGKEAHVFDAPGFDESATPDRIDAAYEPSFGAFAEGAIHGDATPIYLLLPRLVARIARYNARMRWIILLRDPVDRTVSHYHMERTRGQETLPLWAALLCERWRLAGHHDDLALDSPIRRHSYATRSRYTRQLDVLHAAFPREQILLLRHADLQVDPVGCLESVHRHLGVPPAEGGVWPQRVFDGDYDRGGDRMVRAVLRLAFSGEVRRLRDDYGVDLSAGAASPPAGIIRRRPPASTRGHR